MQTVGSKNKNILSRNDKDLPSAGLKAFRISVGGDNMGFLSRTCKTHDDVIDFFKNQSPGQKVVFLE